MTENKIDKPTDKPAMAGGVFIALGMLLGAFAGIYVGQPSAGMIIGFLIGAALAVLIWIYDRVQGAK